MKYAEIIQRILDKRGVSLLACFLLGCVYALPYLAEPLFPCTYIALILFCVILYFGETSKRLFRHCMAFCFGFYLLLYSFLSALYPFESFSMTQAQAIFVIIAACILIPLFHAALHSLVLLLLKPFGGRKALMAVIMPFAWVIAELVIASGTLAFPWGTVALSQTGFLPAVQTAGLFGGYFVTLVTVGGCSLIGYAIADKGKKSYALCGAAVLLLNIALGTVIYFVPAQSDGVLTVAAVQGDVRMEEKWQSGKLLEITERYESLVIEAADMGAELVVMPESAIPTVYKQNNTLGLLYKDIAEQKNISIVAGVLLEGSKSNGVVSVNADGSVGGLYNKRHPVPFGEYIPYSDVVEKVLPFLKNMSFSGKPLEAGEKAEVLECDGVTVGTLVCFDSIFPSLALDEIREGAEIMTVVTNDSWFKVSPGVTQHYRHAKLRAVECGRYYIQAANTGVSAIIDEKGNVVSRGGIQTTECITGEAKIFSHRTLYSLTGDIVPYVAALAVVSALIYTFIMHKREKRKYDNLQGKAV